MHRHHPASHLAVVCQGGLERDVVLFPLAGEDQGVEVHGREGRGGRGGGGGGNGGVVLEEEGERVLVGAVHVGRYAGLGGGVVAWLGVSACHCCE